MVCQHKISWSFRSTEAALLAGAASAASSLRWAPRTESSRPEPNLQAGCTAVFGGPHEMARRGLRLESPWTWDDARKIDDDHDTPLADARSARDRSEEHTSELPSLMRISYAVFCLKKKNTQDKDHIKQIPKENKKY